MPVELGTTTGRANSYVSFEEAATYFAFRAGATAWTNADGSTQLSALLTATNLLERELWIGAVRENDQALAWPRICLLYTSPSPRD